MIERLKSCFLKEMPFFLAAPAVLWAIILFLFPLLCLIFTSFIDQDTGLFSWYNYHHIANITIAIIIIRSLFYALLTTFFTLIIGYPIAYYVAFYARAKEYMLFFLTLPFWTNLIVLVYAWFFLLEREGLINFLLTKLGLITEPLQLAYTTGSVILVMTYCYIPFMIMPLYSVLNKFNMRLLEASCDLGATYFQTLRHVIIPVSLPGIRTGIILVFVPSFGEFIVPALMGGAKQLTVGSLISYYFVVSKNYAIGSAFTILSGLILLLTAILIYFLITLIKK